MNKIFWLGIFFVALLFTSSAGAFVIRDARITVLDGIIVPGGMHGDVFIIVSNAVLLADIQVEEDSSRGIATEQAFLLGGNSPQISEETYEGEKIFTDAFALAEEEEDEEDTDRRGRPARLELSIQGLPAHTETEGVVTSASTTAGAVPFILDVVQEQIAAQRIVVRSTIPSGYRVLAVQRHTLRSDDAAIQNFPAPNEAPASWALPPGAAGVYGYHSGDDTLSGHNPARFAPDDSYAGFGTVFHEVAFHPHPTHKDETDMVYRIAVTNDQNPGLYQTDIVYVVVPNIGL